VTHPFELAVAEGHKAARERWMRDKIAPLMVEAMRIAHATPRLPMVPIATARGSCTIDVPIPSYLRGRYDPGEGCEMFDESTS
jgi:hypothetical protein